MTKKKKSSGGRVTPKKERYPAWWPTTKPYHRYTMQDVRAYLAALIEELSHEE